MDLEVFCLCDGAFNYDGKLTIVGTYDRLLVNTLPQRARLSVAVKLNGSSNEILNGTRVVLSFKDSQHNQVGQDIENTISDIPQIVEVVHLVMAVNTELNISELGTYRAELYLNDTLLKIKEFTVVQR